MHFIVCTKGIYAVKTHNTFLISIYQFYWMTILYFLNIVTIGWFKMTFNIVHLHVHLDSKLGLRDMI
jgi:hypothetical protein